MENGDAMIDVVINVNEQPQPRSAGASNSLRSSEEENIYDVELFLHDL